MYDNNNIVTEFLKPYFFEEDAKKIVGLYNEKIEILEELYFMYLKLHGEHNGFLFIEILKKDSEFWNKFTQFIGKNSFNDIYYLGVFEYVWEQENYSEFIDVAINNMVIEKNNFCYSQVYKKIFHNRETTTLISENQKHYISDFIQRNANNNDNLYLIFDIIANQFEFLQLKYIQELLKYNDNIEVFKKLPLEKSCYSWSGSRIPLIEKQIQNLENIKSILKGSKYLEHRNYLDSLINYRQEEKRTERIREYLDNIYN